MKSSSSSVLHLIDTSCCGWPVLVILSLAGSVGMFSPLRGRNFHKMKSIAKITAKARSTDTIMM
uniref:Uncharacterized protein n=1 Tax=Anguilla anguilla TaxID=7936 RepID=A0A0E9Y0K9_ANGAN